MTTEEAAYEEAWRRWPEPWDHEIDEPVDDWGYAEVQRRAFIEGALWLQGFAEGGEE